MSKFSTSKWSKCHSSPPPPRSPPLPPPSRTHTILCLPITRRPTVHHHALTSLSILCLTKPVILSWLQINWRTVSSSSQFHWGSVEISVLFLAWVCVCVCIWWPCAAISTIKKTRPHPHLVILPQLWTSSLLIFINYLPFSPSSNICHPLLSSLCTILPFPPKAVLTIRSAFGLFKAKGPRIALSLKIMKDGMYHTYMTCTTELWETTNPNMHKSEEDCSVCCTSEEVGLQSRTSANCTSVMKVNLLLQYHWHSQQASTYLLTISSHVTSEYDLGLVTRPASCWISQWIDWRVKSEGWLPLASLIFKQWSDLRFHLTKTALKEPIPPPWLIGHFITIMHIKYMQCVEYPVALPYTFLIFSYRFLHCLLRNSHSQFLRKNSNSHLKKLMDYPLAHSPTFHQVSWQSVQLLLCNPVYRQTDRQH